MSLALCISVMIKLFALAKLSGENFPPVSVAVVMTGTAPICSEISDVKPFADRV